MVKKSWQNKKLKINIFLQKNLKNGHFEAKAYGESKKFKKFPKKFEIGP